MTDHPGDSREADAEFLERIAAPLRSAEFVEGTFEERLMEKIRREGPPLFFEPVRLPVSTPTEPSWWRRERVLRFSPLTGLAAAAGLVGVIALASLAISGRTESVVDGGARATVVEASARGAAAPVASSTDTVHVMRFVFVDAGATSVELVGDFNAWTKGVNKLERSGAPGVWAVSIPLQPGRHEYAFIVNGSRWIADPLAPRTTDDFGTVSAIFNVGPKSECAS